MCNHDIILDSSVRLQSLLAMKQLKKTNPDYIKETNPPWIFFSHTSPLIYSIASFDELTAH